MLLKAFKMYNSQLSLFLVSVPVSWNPLETGGEGRHGSSALMARKAALSIRDMDARDPVVRGWGEQGGQESREVCGAQRRERKMRVLRKWVTSPEGFHLGGSIFRSAALSSRVEWALSWAPEVLG